MTAARHLMAELPGADVVLIERNPVFWSCPFSNKWLIDVVDTDFLLHDMTIPARTWGYSLLHAEIETIDRAQKTVVTAQGRVDYDLPVVTGASATPTTSGSRATAARPSTPACTTLGLHPQCRAPGAEAQPEVVHRRAHRHDPAAAAAPLPPSPYDRACLMAWHIKRHNIPGRITILDPKPKIAPITGGFTAAFEELYPDIITHVPEARVLEVDPFNRHIVTDAGEFDFDDAVLMPPHQAADMVWDAGLVHVAGDGSSNGWADVDPRLFTARDDADVYVIGDAVGPISDQFGYYPKSAHVANALGKIVARNIGQRVRGEEVVPILPDNLCFMLVNGDPLEAVAVKFTYAAEPSGRVVQTLIDVNERTPENLAADFDWYARTTADFLA